MKLVVRLYSIFLTYKTLYLNHISFINFLDLIVPGLHGTPTNFFNLIINIKKTLYKYCEYKNYT